MNQNRSAIDAAGTHRKILMVSTSLGFGGADSQIVSIARVLRSRGWGVTVVSMIPPAAYRSQLEECGARVESLEMTPGAPDCRAIWRLANLIRREKPDVVHSHMFHANLLTRLTRCVAPMPALVCTAHNTRESSQRGGPTWHKELLYRLTDRLANHTTIICQAGFRRYAGTAVPASRLEVIPIGIDCCRFRPDPELRAQARRELQLAENDLTFLAVGRMVVQKDYPNLLRAFARLGERRWRLLVAGTGPLESEVQHLCRELGLEAQVRFLGVKEDVRPWFNAADAFVMGSAVEGMPVVLLEAAACGLPAIVTAAGGCAEVVVNGQTGFVAPIRNDVALAEALNRFVDLPAAQRAEFAANARSRALREFEIAGIVFRWESIYLQCLRKSRSAPALHAVSTGVKTR